MAIAVSPEATQGVESRFEVLVLDFLAYLEFERGLARNTLDAYRGDIADFLADLATGHPARDGEDGRQPCSPSTIGRKAAALRSFYRHLRREELVGADPTARLVTPARGRKLPHVLGYGEVK